MVDVQKIVDGIAKDLELIAKGEAHLDENGEYTDNEDAPLADFYNYFEDVYDIEFLIRFNGSYRASIIMVACGGPNIWVDTFCQEVRLAWGSWSAKAYLTIETCNAIDDYWREVYEMTRN